jgi:peptide/nickel transport system permease protein
LAAVEPIHRPGLLRQRRTYGGAGRVRAAPLADKLALGALATVTLLAILGPTLAPHNPLAGVGPANHPPSMTYPFGTDEVGRDMFSRVLVGIQSTWLAAIAVISAGVLTGGAIGLISGVLGGWVDSLLMRITDVFLALPPSILAIAVVAAIGPSLFHTLLAVAIFWWPYYARLVRAETRSLAARPHLVAARLAGVGWTRRLWRHILPGTIPTAVVAASLDVSNLILLLTGLSFLGLGAQPPDPELGSMIASNLSNLLTSWWIPVIPGIAVFLLSLVANLSGDAIRDLMERT